MFVFPKFPSLQDPWEFFPFPISSHYIQVPWILSLLCQMLPGPSNSSCLCHPEQSEQCSSLLLNPLPFSVKLFFFPVSRAKLIKTTGRKVKNILTQVYPPIPPSVPTPSSRPTQQCDVTLEASLVGQVC